MKMTLEDVEKRCNGLDQIKGLTLPVKVAFAIACNFEKLKKEYELLVKQREELYKKYAKKDTDGQPVMTKSVVQGRQVWSYEIEENARGELEKELEELMEEKVDVDIRTVKFEQIEQCETKERYDIPTAGAVCAMSFMLEK